MPSATVLRAGLEGVSRAGAGESRTVLTSQLRALTEL